MKLSVTKRSFAPAAALLLLLLCGAAQVAPAAMDNTMYNYCQVPPYVIQNVQPNVMLIVSNSQSMFKFAYAPANATCSTDNAADPLNGPCGGFQSAATYTGLFNSGAYYKYDSSSVNAKFFWSAWRVNPDNTVRAKAADEWDGNFLNWLTMRRIDVLRKVLTGGKDRGGFTAGYQPVDNTYGVFKALADYAAYIPSAISPGNLKHTYATFAAGNNNNHSYFTVEKNIGGIDTFYVRVDVPSGTTLEGVLQAMVGTRARLGLTFFRADNEGGGVEPPIGGQTLSSMVERIETPSNMNAGSASPLAETLLTVAGYFAQQSDKGNMPAPIGSCPVGISYCGPTYGNPNKNYPIGNLTDPYNFGIGHRTRYPRCAKSYVILITDGEPCADGNLPSGLSDMAHGLPTDCDNNICNPPGGYFPAETIPSCPLDGNVAGIEDVALYAHTRDFRSAIDETQNLTLYVIQAFGADNTGSTLLKYAAINGSFEDGNGTQSPDDASEWDGNGDGWPDTYYLANGGSSLEQALKDAFSGILKRASSGTAASVLASGEGSGANLVQAVFYPRRRIGNDVISWAGSLQNLWYYVDPYFANSSIRDDYSGGSPDRILDLRDDRIAQLYFDRGSNFTKARLIRDTDGDGDGDVSAGDPILFEDLASLWEAGDMLWARNLSTAPRRIYTSLDNTTLTEFTTDHASDLMSSLNVASTAEAELVIRYIQGEDVFVDADNDNVSDLRSRTVNRYGSWSVWRLGDIVNSTPRISSWIPLNTYYKVYNDVKYDEFTKTTGTIGYKSRGMVFTGGNDGMLHAFKLGKLELEWEATPPQDRLHEKARLSEGADGIPLGQEVWAFIPRNALPYLKYQGEVDYCHTYTVDLTPFVFDASIGRAPYNSNYYDQAKTGTDNTWRTILIGGMRTGGACRNAGSTEADTVAAPMSGLGYSSYFALDVTDQSNPTLLWEFSDPNLGFATTGPAVVRISARTGSPAQPDSTKNGHWYVVFGSGPTGPIDTTYMQFMGRSSQPLRLFVLDLPTGTLLNTFEQFPSSNISNAFVGSLYNASTDTDTDYEDDAIYFGYTKSSSGTPGSNTWTDGGVGRLLTHEDPDVSNWTANVVIDGTGPITSAVARLRNRTLGQLWFFFGSGRYFFEADPANTDDPGTRRRMFGIKEPCYSGSYMDPTCTNTVSIDDLDDRTTLSGTPAESPTGWYVFLDPASIPGDDSTYYTYDNVTLPYRAERVITDPVTTGSGVAFFTTYKPYADECGLGGKSFLWALQYNTGGAPRAALKGKALVQVSTAAVEQINLQDAFTSHDGRSSPAMEGVPPTAQGLSLIAPPPPIRKVLHMRER